MDTSHSRKILKYWHSTISKILLNPEILVYYQNSCQIEPTENYLKTEWQPGKPVQKPTNGDPLNKSNESKSASDDTGSASDSEQEPTGAEGIIWYQLNKIKKKWW